VAVKLTHAAASLSAYGSLPAEAGWLAIFGAEMVSALPHAHRHTTTQRFIPVHVHECIYTEKE
jgi:hypothetical protein